MKIKMWELALAAAFLITVITGCITNREQQQLNEKLIRLHVVANSDSKTDQNLKIKVKDEIVTQLNAILSDAENKNNAVELICNSTDYLKMTAENVIHESGFDYPVTVTIKEEDFPTKEYDTFSLPAGKYDSLRITIGDGGGQNWWCVVFPPVCSSQILTEEAAASVGLTTDEYRLITEDGPEYVIKFRFMELLGKLKAKK